MGFALKQEQGFSELKLVEGLVFKILPGGKTEAKPLAEMIPFDQGGKQDCALGDHKIFSSAPLSFKGEWEGFSLILVNSPDPSLEERGVLRFIEGRNNNAGTVQTIEVLSCGRRRLGFTAG